MFDNKKVLDFIGYHGGTDFYRLADHLNVNNEKAKQILEELYSDKKLIAFISPTCPETGNSLLTQKLDNIPLNDYVYKCEDMDGECVFCGSEHTFEIDSFTPFYTLIDSLKEQYPRRKTVNKQEEQIKGLVAQIDEMHKFIVQLKEGALANRYIARIFLEVDDPEGNYYVGAAGPYWRNLKH